MEVVAAGGKDRTGLRYAADITDDYGSPVRETREENKGRGTGSPLPKLEGMVMSARFTARLLYAAISPSRRKE